MTSPESPSGGRPSEADTPAPGVTAGEGPTQSAVPSSASKPPVPDDAPPPTDPLPASGGAVANDSTEDKTTRARRAAKPARWWELPLLIVVAVAVAVLVKSFLVQPFYIPSESMENTLYGCSGCQGDKILVNKPIYHLRDPHPGDIVVFRAPKGWEEPIEKPNTNAVLGVVRSFGQLVGVVPPDETDLVKRVIATGGQTVRCCDAEGRVQISKNGPNGPWRSLSETYLFEDDSMKFGPVTVPKGRLWVMGDHRQDSKDSRYHCGSSQRACDPVSSTVPNSAVIGKAFVIAWPPHRWRTLGTPKTFDSAAGLATATVPAGVGMISVAPLLWRRRRRSRR